MQVTLLGTGCPQVHTRRYGPASLMRHGDKQFLIDCGSGVTQQLLGAGTSGAALEALLLTHLHSDHLVDLYQLIVSSWHQGRDRPQRIFGPRGTRAFGEATMAAWQSERALRIQWECRASTAALELEVVEFGEGTVWQADDLRISAFHGRPPPGRAGLRLPVRDRCLPGRVLGRHHGLRQPGARSTGRRSPGARMLPRHQIISTGPSPWAVCSSRPAGTGSGRGGPSVPRWRISRRNSMRLRCRNRPWSAWRAQ